MPDKRELKYETATHQKTMILVLLGVVIVSLFLLFSHYNNRDSICNFNPSGLNCNKECYCSHSGEQKTSIGPCTYSFGINYSNSIESSFIETSDKGVSFGVFYCAGKYNVVGGFCFSDSNRKYYTPSTQKQPCPPDTSGGTSALCCQIKETNYEILNSNSGSNGVSYIIPLMINKNKTIQYYHLGTSFDYTNLNNTIFTNKYLSSTLEEYDLILNNLKNPTVTGNLLTTPIHNSINSFNIAQDELHNYNLFVNKRALGNSIKDNICVDPSIVVTLPQCVGKFGWWNSPPGSGNLTHQIGSKDIYDLSGNINQDTAVYCGTRHAGEDISLGYTSPPNTTPQSSNIHAEYDVPFDVTSANKSSTNSENKPFPNIPNNTAYGTCTKRKGGMICNNSSGLTGENPLSTDVYGPSTSTYGYVLMKQGSNQNYLN